MDPDSLKTSTKNTNATKKRLKATKSGGGDDYEEIDPQTAGETELDEYVLKVRADFRYDLLAHDNYIQNFDAYEAMLISQPYDSVSKKIQSGLSDGRTTTIYQERAARVMGQLPKGSMKAAGKKDAGASAVLDIILQKYVYPNANAQAPLLEKFRNWQFYSSVYGYMPMFYDWDVDESSGYIGPQCWLWHPRNFIPQIGYASIDDMEYVTALTFVGKGFIEDLMEQDDDAGYDKDECKVLLDLIEERLRFPDARRDSLVTRERQSQADKGRIMLATRYECGEDGNWVTFAPEYNGVVIRTIRNPHKNGKIPFVVKYATPLFDNFYGLGDFQRAKPLQFASDGLDAFYFASLKRGLYPPTIINPAGVVKSSITQDPGAIWQETIKDSIREYATNPVGMSTYQNAKTLMNSALMNQAGTTDMASTAMSADPASGKSPQGIAQQQQRESARDNQDRFYLESKIEVLVDRMMGLFGTIATEDIPVDLFVDDFKDIEVSGWGDDLKDMIEVSDSQQSGHMTIKPAFFKNLSLRFYLDANSTAKADKSAQLTNLEGFVKNLTSMQNVLTQANDQGWMLDVVQIAKLEEDLSDVPEMGKIFRKMTPEEQQTYQQSKAAANPKPPEQIDTTAFKDLPLWTRPQWLGKQGYQQPQGATMTTPAEEMKAQEIQIKQQQANKPATGEKAPAKSTKTPVVVHNGHTIADPKIAAAHIKLGEMANGNTK